MNKKVNVEIQEFEPKTSQAGKHYARFKTNLGWMSAFDKPIIKALEDKIGERVNLLIAVDDEKGFKNIRKILKSSQNELNEDDDDGEAEEDSDEEMEEPKEQVPTSRPTNPRATMWASYAKDIFLVLRTQTDKEIGNDLIMQSAIGLIKQARTAFE